MARVQIEDVYDVVAAVEGIGDGVVPIIVRMVQDIPFGLDAQLALLAVHYHGHRIEPHFRSGPITTLRVIKIPTRCVRHAVLVASNVDLYCAQEGDRCLVHVNHLP